MKRTTLLFTVLLVFLCNAGRSQLAAYSFSAGTGSYIPISGIAPALTGDGVDSLRDEGFANNIPIGFTFNYLGTDYTAIAASTNGFASFGLITNPGFSNNLAIGGTGRPLLAPLWEDLALESSSDLQYITEGSAGSRVFVLQWSQVYFDFGANSPSLSFQLKLYEGTNIIEFIYDTLPGSVEDFSGGASIGITSGATGEGSFLSLNNSGANPSASSSVAINSINTKPAAGQLFRFTPPACAAPGGLSFANIGPTSVTLAWAGTDAGAYEWAITPNPSPPPSGTQQASLPLTVGGLTPCTPYYVHVRKSCGSSASGWNRFRFTTTCEAASIPYTMDFATVNPPLLPTGVSVKDNNQDGNTWRSYPSGGQGWTGPVLAYVYNIDAITGADDWLFTRGLDLTAGTTYRLSFRYNNDHSSQFTEKLKVAYGLSASPAGMTSVLADYSAVYSPAPKTALIDFTPSSSGVYYIGFQAYSEADKNVLLLNNINIGLRPACDLPTGLDVQVQESGTSVFISWDGPSLGSPSGYEYAISAGADDPSAGTPVDADHALVSGLAANEQYYLHVRSKCGAAYSGWASLLFNTVPNDKVCNAIPLVPGTAPVCGNTKLATIDPTDPYSSCSVANNTVWYKYTAIADGTIVLHITTPPAPARPLHGWINWYLFSGDCSNVSFTTAGYCSEFGHNGNDDAVDIISPTLTAGVTYYLMVDGFSGEYGEFCISIPPCAPAIDIAIEDILSTSAYVNWQGTGSFIVEYGPAGFTPGNADLAGGGIVINPANAPQMITGLTAQTTYDVYVRQDCSQSSNGYSSNSSVKRFTTLGTPPPNDDCAGAIALPVTDAACNAPVAGTTLNATPSDIVPYPDCGNEEEGVDDDVWYSFTPAAGQEGVDIEVTSTGGDFDLVAQVYTTTDNTCNGDFELYACSDADGPNDSPAFYNLPVTPGITYYIRVFSYKKAVNSQFSLCVFKPALSNDNAPGAKTLIVGEGCGGAPYTNVGATQSAAEPAGSCSSTTGYATVWFKFVAPPSGAVRVNTALGFGNTLTNSRVALFEAQDVFNYNTFNIIACDEDGGSGAFSDMSVLYATDLTPNATYFIQVDKYDAASNSGTFCITVDELNASMLSDGNSCDSSYQQPVGAVSSYTGWVPLMDENSKLIAMIRNIAGGRVDAYRVSQNVNTGPVRQDNISGEYYLDRNYHISNVINSNSYVDVQFFFKEDELNALQAVDPAATLERLRITRQSGNNCQPDFVAANGSNAELSQTKRGTSNGVSWIRTNSSGLSNFYLHSTKAPLNAKCFLQGAFNASLSRHKDVTQTWANVLNTYALNQPYNTAAFGNYDGTESVDPGFFKSTAATTDVVDWVLLELKSITGALIARRAAFVREDGAVVDLDGVSPVSFASASGNFYVTIRHRNHLGISSQPLIYFNARALGTLPASSANFNFSEASDANIFGDAQAYKVINGVNVMIGGNANSNGNVRYANLSNDPGAILVFIGGSVITVVNNVYSACDVNMDGIVRYANLNNDPGWIFSNVLGGVVTIVVNEQKR